MGDIYLEDRATLTVTGDYTQEEKVFYPGGVDAEVNINGNFSVISTGRIYKAGSNAKVSVGGDFVYNSTDGCYANDATWKISGDVTQGPKQGALYFNKLELLTKGASVTINSGNISTLILDCGLSNFDIPISHPMAYVNAWLLTSYGYVYPPAAFNVYKGNSVYTFTYDESSYFGYETEPPGERKVLIPAIDRLYRYLSLGPFYKDHPVLYLFFAPGLYLVIYMFVFAYRLSKRRYGQVLPFLPMILCFCTVLLGPTYLIRYVLYLWLCLPLLFV